MGPPNTHLAMLQLKCSSWLAQQVVFCTGIELNANTNTCTQEQCDAVMHGTCNALRQPNISSMVHVDGRDSLTRHQVDALHKDASGRQSPRLLWVCKHGG